MYKIRKAEKLADKIYLMDVEAPRVAKHWEPGPVSYTHLDVYKRQVLMSMEQFEQYIEESV